MLPSLKKCKTLTSLLSFLLLYTMLLLLPSPTLMHDKTMKKIWNVCVLVFWRKKKIFSTCFRNDILQKKIEKINIFVATHDIIPYYRVPITLPTLLSIPHHEIFPYLCWRPYLFHTSHYKQWWCFINCMWNKRAHMKKNTYILPLPYNDDYPSVMYTTVEINFVLLLSTYWHQ